MHRRGLRKPIFLVASSVVVAVCFSVASAYIGMRSCERNANPRLATVLPADGGVFSSEGRGGRWTWSEHTTPSARWGQLIDLNRAGIAPAAGVAAPSAADRAPEAWVWISPRAEPIDKYVVIDWAEVGWPCRFARAAHAQAAPGFAGFQSVVIAGWDRSETDGDGPSVVGGPTAVAWAWPTAVSVPLLALNTLAWWSPLGCALLGVAAAGSFTRWRRARGGKCPACGYDRSGIAIAAACPECGRVAG